MSVTNPLWTSMSSAVPGGNPSGVNVSVPQAGPTAGGVNPFLATSIAGSLSPSSMPTNQNPYAAGHPASTTPTFGANTGGYSSSLNLTPPGTAVPGSVPGTTQPVSGIGGMSGMNSTQLNKMLTEFVRTYGKGTGSALFNFLTSGAGYNQQAINNLLAGMQPGIERGEENLAEQFSATGNRFGSPAGIGMADYLSQVNLDEGTLISNMYEQAVNDYLNTLLGISGQEATLRAGQPSTMDSILGAIGLGGSLAGGASAGLSAASSGAGGIGSILAGLAAI